MKKLVQSYNIPIMAEHPNWHTANNRPPNIRDELPRCNVKSRKKLHDEGMDKEMETTQKSSLIEAHLVVGKGASFIIGTG